MRKRLMLATAAAMMASALVAPAALAADNGVGKNTGLLECHRSGAPTTYDEVTA